MQCVEEWKVLVFSFVIVALEICATSNSLADNWSESVNKNDNKSDNSEEKSESYTLTQKEKGALCLALSSYPNDSSSDSSYNPIVSENTPTRNLDKPNEITSPAIQITDFPRTRPTYLTTGASPVDIEIGSEIDFIDTPKELDEVAVRAQPWTFTMRGYLRAPMRIGFGPRNDQTPGTEWHSKPRIPGASSGDWTYTSLSANQTANFFMTIGNRKIAANLAFGSNTFNEAGWKDVDSGSMGVIYQAYISVRYPNAFGRRGGITLMAGSFGNRYGLSGPGWRNSGHYTAYLFGRTKVAGVNVTSTIDLTNRMQMVLEQGVGGKLEEPPFVTSDTIHPGGVKKSTYVPSQGNVPFGSGFLLHSHAGVFYDEWLRVVAHYFDDYSPNDNALLFNTKVGSSRLQTVGAEFKVNSKTFGSFYLGYNHIWAKNVSALKDQLSLLNSSDGKGFKANFFGKKDVFDFNFTPANDSGNVEAVLFEYQMHPGALLPASWLSPPKRRDLWPSLSLSGLHFSIYGLYNYVNSPNPDVYDFRQKEIRLSKLKFGVDFAQMLYRWLYFGVRYDYVHPDLSLQETRFLVLSPRLVLRSNYKSKEYVILTYSHFWSGERVSPTAPYSSLKVIDKNMISLTAIMSF